jgi:hypothetical protein
VGLNNSRNVAGGKNTTVLLPAFDDDALVVMIVLPWDPSRGHAKLGGKPIPPFTVLLMTRTVKVGTKNVFVASISIIRNQLP